MKSSDPADAFKDFEHAGWETVAAYYKAHFGGLTVQSIAPCSIGPGWGTAPASWTWRRVPAWGRPRVPAWGRRRIETVPLLWKLSSPDMFFQAIYEGSVRTRALLRAQGPDALEAIRRVIGEKLKAYEKNGVTELPMPAVLSSAENT